MNSANPESRPELGPNGPKFWLICLLLATLTLGAYSRVLHSAFINYDDPDYVTENPPVAHGLSLQGLHWAFFSYHAGNWHPLTWISHMLDCQLFGLKPAGHHATNLFFHLLNSLFLFWLLKRMTGALWRSAFVAALFALHPLHVESVAWVSERKDVLSTFFGLLSLGAYAAYAQSKVVEEVTSVECRVTETKTAPRITHHGTRDAEEAASIFHLPSSIFYLLSLVLFACSLMSKPMLVTLPCVLLLLDFWPLGRWQAPQVAGRAGGQMPEVQRSVFDVRCSRLLRLLCEKLPFLGVSAVSCIITWFAQKAAGAVIGFAVVPLSGRIGNSMVAVACYLKKMFWPVDLAVFYPYIHRPIWQVLCSGLLLAGLSFLALRGPPRRAWLTTGWFWFMGTLVPVIGLFQVGLQSMADRYSYFPSIGLFLALSWGAAAWAGSQFWRRIAGASAAALLLISCLLQTRNQLFYWHDSETLFTHAFSVTEDNYITRNNLGAALLEQDKLDQALTHFQAAFRINPEIPETRNNLAWVLLKQGKLEESIAQAAAALRLNPKFPPAQVNLGRALYLQGRYAQAVESLAQAAQSLPDHPVAHADLGDAMFKLGKWDDAIAHYSKALRLEPAAEVENSLAQALARQGNLREAILHWQQAVRINPQFAEAHFFLGNAFVEDAKPDDAITHLQQALRLKPDLADARSKLATILLGRHRVAEALQQYRELLRITPESFAPLNNLAWILATHPDPKLRNGAEAVQLAERASLLAGPNSPSALDTLAAAYAEAGRFPEASVAIQKAIVLAEAAKETNAVAAFRSRLELYRAGKSYREQ